MVDIGQKMAEGKGGGYVHWAKQFNLQQMSQTMLYLEKYGFQSPEEVEEALRGAIRSERDTVQQIRGKERQIAENKELMRQAENYRRTKATYDGLKKIKRAKRRAEYEEENRTELALFAAAGRHFKAKGLTKLPQTARLQEKNERLISEKNGLCEELREKRAKTGELQSMKANLDAMLRRERQAHKELDVFL